VLTERFISEHHLDLVVHGFADQDDADRQAHLFRVPRQRGIFRAIPYHHGISTTELLKRINQ
jgi:glycerol-3-phosphate cytidylyltransferase-like family protein